MDKAIDITGRTFGRLRAICVSGRTKKNEIQWQCECVCGNITYSTVANLSAGRKRSCGCIAYELLMERSTKHGMRHTPEWHIWAQMIGRCNNPRNKGYKNYGERGIRIEDPRWLKFIHFFEDMGKRPNPELTLDRLDNDKGYCKDNCAWRTRKEQSRNRRNRHWVTYNGETKILSEWAEILQLPFSVLFYRLKKWPPEVAFSRPKLKTKPYHLKT